MKRLLTLFFLWLGTLNGWAQAPSPAQMGITTATPNAVQVLDSSKTWATIGTVDPATHLFSPAGVVGVLPPLVTSFNTRTGAVTLSSLDVTTALTFTPYNATNPAGYITSSALTPYALLASPAFTGTPSLPTGTTGVTQPTADSSTKLATTAFAHAAITANAYTLPPATTTILGGVKVDGTTITAAVDGTISGTPAGITANSTVTSGFAPYQVMLSDGTKVQPWHSGVPAEIGNYTSAGYSLALIPSTTDIGFNSHLHITSQGYSDYYGLNLFAGSVTGIEMAAGPGVAVPRGFFGFTNFSNSSETNPDVAFTTTGANISAFRALNGNVAENLRVYNAITDFNNGEWGGFDWQTVPNTLTIGSGANGTGTQRPVNIVGSSVTINGAAIGGGTITAGTTPTSGYTAGQLVVSDGTKVRTASPTTSGVYWGDATHPIVMSSNNSASGTYGTLWFSTQDYPGAFGLGIQVGTPSGSGFTASQNYGYYGFNTSDNYIGDPPDVGLTAITYSNGDKTIGFRGINGPTGATNTRFYNTWTDQNNGEWGAFDWKTVANVLQIGTEKNGTGATRNLEFVVGNTNQMDYGVTVASAWTATGSLGVTGAHVARGTKPTLTTGTCSGSAAAGGATAGTFVLSAICAAAGTVILTAMPAAPTGYSCDMEDRVTRAATIVQSATTTTSATFIMGSTPSVAADVLQWKCMGY